MQDKDKRDFQTYGALMALLAAGIAHMFYTMWIGGAWRLVRPVSELSFVPDGATGIIALVLLGAGLYTGFLLLFLNDYRKYYQGLLIAAGSVVVTLALAGLGIGLPSMSLSVLNVASFLLGLVLALTLETAQFDAFDVNGDLRYIDLSESQLGHARGQDGESLNFTLASYGLVGMIVLLVLVGNALNVLVAMPNVGALQLGHAVVSVAFLFFLNSFVRLNLEDSAASDTQFEILGPTQSGKTYSILALYLEAKSNDSYDITDMGGEMTTLVEEHAQMADARGGGPDATLDWSIDNTLPDRTYELSFEIQKNDAVPTQKVSFDTVDHAGELLEDISYGLVGTEAATDGGQDRQDDEEAEGLGDLFGDDSTDDEESESETDSGADEESGFDTEPVDDDSETQSGFDTESSDNDSEAQSGFDTEPVDDDSEAQSGFDTEPADDDSEGQSGFDTESSDDDSDAQTGFDTEASDDINDDSETDTIRDVVESESEAFDGVAESEAEAVEEAVESETVVTPDDEADESGDAEGDDEPFGGDEPDDEESTSEEVTRGTPQQPDTAFGQRGDTDDSERESETVRRPSTMNEDTKAGLDPNQAVDIVVQNINSSDRLVMLLDTERFLGGEPAGPGSQSMEISNLNRIRKNAPVDKDDITLLATKADLLIEEWQEERGYGAAPSESEQRWEDFSDWVSTEYEENDLVGGFMSTLGTGKVYPVYFETEDRDGSIEPKPGENGGLQPHGYDEALDAIIRDN